MDEDALYKREKFLYGTNVANLRRFNRSKEVKPSTPDHSEYFSKGDPMWRGERRVVPEGVTTPQQMVEHMFPGGKGEVGKSWTLNKFVAEHFGRQRSMPMHFVEKSGRPVQEALGNMAHVVMHSNVNPENVSFDSGQIPDATGKMVNWGPGWQHRVGRLAPKGSSLRRGDQGEAELIMKNDTEIPVHGMTMYFGSSMNYHQFDEPLKAVTKYRHSEVR